MINFANVGNELLNYLSWIVAGIFLAIASSGDSTPKIRKGRFRVTKILVCNRTRSVLDHMHTWLHDAGYLVHRGDNRHRSRARYREANFDLIISDDEKWLRELDDNNERILDTADLPKPITKENLLESVRKALREPLSR